MKSAAFLPSNIENSSIYRWTTSNELSISCSHLIRDGVDGAAGGGAGLRVAYTAVGGAVRDHSPAPPASCYAYRNGMLWSLRLLLLTYLCMTKQENGCAFLRAAGFANGKILFVSAIVLYLFQCLRCCLLQCFTVHMSRAWVVSTDGQSDASKMGHQPMLVIYWPAAYRRKLGDN